MSHRSVIPDCRPEAAEAPVDNHNTALQTFADLTLLLDEPADVADSLYRPEVHPPPEHGRSSTAALSCLESVSHWPDAGE